MIIDIFVALTVLGAAFVGFQRGFIQPLLAEILFVGTLLVLLNNRDTFLGFMKDVFHASAAGQPIERDSSEPQIFGDQHELMRCGRAVERVRRLIDVRGLAAVERDRTLAGK